MTCLLTTLIAITSVLRTTKLKFSIYKQVHLTVPRAHNFGLFHEIYIVLGLLHRIGTFIS